RARPAARAVERRRDEDRSRAMRARTEDLLTLRDGGPIDAALRERLAADPEVTREIARLDRVAEDLRRLPMLEPPPGVWERIAQEGSARQRATRTGLHYRPAPAAAANDPGGVPRFGA